jgi:hypothetical protein
MRIFCDRDVVIMANKEKSQMDEEVRKALKGCKNMKWHTRSGSPHCITDLESVAAGQAQTVILLCPENTEVRRCVAFVH